LFTKVLVLLLLAGIGWQLFTLRAQVESAQTERDHLAAQVQAQQQKNDALAADIAAGGTQEQLEEIARAQLGWVYPGERVFVDTSN
jgi:cell division protein FtsL